MVNPADLSRLSVAGIVHSTAADGPGLRTALYVAGCPIHCEGCHNKQWWNIESGAERTLDSVYEELMEDDTNISILGGEPLYQYPQILQLCQMIKEKHPDKTIWLWSGYEWNYIAEHLPGIVEVTDALITGPYIEELANPNCEWAGSINQEIHYKD
jgi:anaerobic ribonucleoside-triphosphate reductase activating protein